MVVETTARQSWRVF